MLTKCERPRFQQRQRACRGRAATGGEQDAEATIGMTHKMGTISHEIGDVLGITKEVLATSRRASSIPTPIEHQQSKTLVSERSLRLPLVGSGRQRSVNQHDRGSLAPLFQKEVGHSFTFQTSPGLTFPSRRSHVVRRRAAVVSCHGRICDRSFA